MTPRIGAAFLLILLAPILGAAAFWHAWIATGDPGWRFGAAGLAGGAAAGLWTLVSAVWRRVRR